MKVYDAASIRNVALVGHSGSGKTQLASAILADAGMVNRFGKVDEGTTVTDFDEEEIARKHTLSASLAYAEWNKQKDQPHRHAGHRQLSERRARRAARRRRRAGRRRRGGRRHGADRKGVGRGRRARAAAPGRGQPPRSRAREPRALAAVAARASAAARSSRFSCRSAKRRRSAASSISCRRKPSSSRPTKAASSPKAPVPADMTAAVDGAREALIEMVAEADEKLMEKFFEAGTLTDEELVAGPAQRDDGRRSCSRWCARRRC